MGYLPVVIPLFAILATILGLIGILFTNSSRCPVKVYWGRWLFVLVFLTLGCGSLTLALTWQRGVLSTCLGMAVLFLGILWHPSTPVEEGEVF